VDDLWNPGALKLLGQDLLLHPEASVVHGKIVRVYESRESGGWISRPSSRDNFLFSIGSGLYRRDVFGDVGGFDEELTYGEDTEWYARLQTSRLSITIPDIITKCRVHESNMTNDVMAMEAGSRKAYQKILALRLRHKRRG
jgi:hypothetical protein